MKMAGTYNCIRSPPPPLSPAEHIHACNRTLIESGGFEGLSMVRTPASVGQRRRVPNKILVHVAGTLQLKGESLGRHPRLERTDILAEKSLAWSRGSLEFGSAGLGTIGDKLDAHIVPSEGDAIGDFLSIPDCIPVNVDDEVTMATVHTFVLPIEVVACEGLGLVETIPRANLLSITTLVQHYLVLVCLLTAWADDLDERSDVLVFVPVMKFIDPCVGAVHTGGQGGGSSGCQERHDIASGGHVFF